MSFFKSTFSSNSPSNLASSSNSSINLTPNAPKKKSVTYILNASNDDHMKGHHSIGVNSLLYNQSDNCLVSGGRDGQISIWKLNSDQNGSSLGTNDIYDNFRSRNEIRNYIFENIDNEEEFANLESSINTGVCSAPISKSNSVPQYHKSSYLHHFDWINDMKLMNDNQTIASCSNDLSIKLWNYHSNTKLTLGYHEDYIKKIGYSKNLETQLVSGGLDNVIKLWDIVKGQPISDYKFERSNSIYSLDVNDNLIISSGPSNVIHLFDRRDMQQPIKSFLGHTDNVRSLILKNSSFLSGSSDSSIKLWDLRTTRILRNFDMHDSPVWSLSSPSYSADDFSIFYSADKSGLLLKTDLRSSDLTSSNVNGYFNYKINESLGISTVIANINYTNNQTMMEDIHSTSSHLSLALSGVTCIAEAEDLKTIWTSTASTIHNSSTNFISSWSIPQTAKLVVYQGLFLNKKLASLYNPNRTPGVGENGSTTPTSQTQQYFNFSSRLSPAHNAVPTTQSPNQQLDALDPFRTDTISGAEDLVSQLSNDDLDKIDDALLSNAQGLDNVLLDAAGNIDSSVNGDDTIVHENGSAIGAVANAGLNIENLTFSANDIDKFGYEDEIEYGTCFVGLLGNLNTHFTFTQEYFEDLENEELADDITEVDPFKEDAIDQEEFIQVRRKLAVNYEDINEDTVLLLPFNIKPVSIISGTTGLIKYKALNNRRHVASMDQNGCFYIFDVLECKMVQRIDSNVSVTSIETTDKLHTDGTWAEHDTDPLNLSDRFEAICNKIQTHEALPAWFSVCVKSGQLFITIEEGKFTSCEIYDDEFLEYYHCADTSHPKNIRVNLGKILLQSFFKNAITSLVSPSIGQMLLSSSQSIHAMKKERNSSINVVNGETTANSHQSATFTKSATTPTKKGFFGRLKSKDNKKEPSSSSSSSSSPPQSKSSGSSTDKNFNNSSNSNIIKEKFESYMEKINTLDDNLSLIKYIEQNPEIITVFMEHKLTQNLLSNECADYSARLFQYGSNGNNNAVPVSSPLLVINEETNTGTRSTFTINLDQLLTKKCSKELAKNLPIWIVKSLLLNLYPVSPALSRKIGFMVKPKADCGLELAGKENENCIKLNASSTLRVSRIKEFVVNKLKGDKSVEIEVYCKGVPLSPKDTIGTVKTRNWKQGGDIIFEFCEK